MTVSNGKYPPPCLFISTHVEDRAGLLCRLRLRHTTGKRHTVVIVCDATARCRVTLGTRVTLGLSMSLWYAFLLSFARISNGVKIRFLGRPFVFAARAI
jgi:hypothetical protein